MADYLYNGIRLPQLPEWDKSKYPYTTIYLDADGYRLICSEHRIVTYSSNTGVYCIWQEEALDSSGHIETSWAAVQVYGVDDSEWAIVYEADEADIQRSIGVTSENILWSSYPIWWLDESAEEGDLGDVYLAASDPIPVGGAEPTDPATLLMGYRVGQLIRGMRRS